MLIDPDKARDEAMKLEQPVIAFDPLQGSSMGRFFLMEYQLRGPRPTDLPPHLVQEMSRQCFNRMRDLGMLKTALSDRMRVHDQCQAWVVIKV